MAHPRIDLAHEPDFTIGRLNVYPSTRELEHGGERGIIEPRVMQVLVALHRASGAVVSKDDLAISCWEGRVVGEDAINRVLSRLRKVSEGIAGGVFRIETVTRIGYRLIAEGEANPSTVALVDAEKARRHFVARRSILVGGTVLLASAGSMLFLSRRSALPSELSVLLNDADTALKYATVEQVAAAVGLLQEASQRFPGNAEVWGKLAIAYRRQGVNNALPSGVSILDRSEAAARRALEIDPQNIDGAVVLSLGRGLWYASYEDYDRRTRQAFARFPGHEIARGARSTFLFETGRIRDSLNVSTPITTGVALSPRATSYARKLWSAGRLDEAEALLDTLLQRWPRNQSIWRSRLAFLNFSGRFKESSAMLGEGDMLSNIEKWPDNLEESDIRPIRLQVSALETNDPDQIAEVLKHFDSVAPIDVEQARDAAGFASITGQLDAAFEYLDMLFVHGMLARSTKQSFPARFFRPHSGKHTYFLFEPPMKNARADPRFNVLTKHLGLTNYWRDAKVTPDYLKILYKSM